MEREGEDPFSRKPALRKCSFTSVPDFSCSDSSRFVVTEESSQVNEEILVESDGIVMLSAPETSDDEEGTREDGQFFTAPEELNQATRSGSDEHHMGHHLTDDQAVSGGDIAEPTVDLVKVSDPKKALEMKLTTGPETDNVLVPGENENSSGKLKLCHQSDVSVRVDNNDSVEKHVVRFFTALEELNRAARSEEHQRHIMSVGDHNSDDQAVTGSDEAELTVDLLKVSHPNNALEVELTARLETDYLLVPDENRSEELKSYHENDASVRADNDDSVEKQALLGSSDCLAASVVKEFEEDRCIAPDNGQHTDDNIVCGGSDDAKDIADLGNDSEPRVLEMILYTRHAPDGELAQNEALLGESPSKKLKLRHETDVSAGTTNDVSFQNQVMGSYKYVGTTSSNDSEDSQEPMRISKEDEVMGNANLGPSYDASAEVTTGSDLKLDDVSVDVELLGNVKHFEDIEKFRYVGPSRISPCQMRRRLLPSISSKLAENVGKDAPSDSNMSSHGNTESSFDCMLRVVRVLAARCEPTINSSRINLVEILMKRFMTSPLPFLAPPEDNENTSSGLE